MTLCTLAVLALVLVGTPARCAEDQPPIQFEDVKWQAAEPADMAIFEPYVGTFRGTTQKADDGTEFYFAITYGGNRTFVATKENGWQEISNEVFTRNEEDRATH